MKLPRIELQVLVHVSTNLGKPFWVHMFDPQPYLGIVLKLSVHIFDPLVLSWHFETTPPRTLER